jgi:hypothetical protein
MTVADIYGPDFDPSFVVPNGAAAGANPADTPTQGNQLSDATATSADSDKPTFQIPGGANINPLWVGLGGGALLILGAKHFREWRSKENFAETKVGMYFIVMVILVDLAFLPAAKGLLQKSIVWKPVKDYTANA